MSYSQPQTGHYDHKFVMNVGTSGSKSLLNDIIKLGTSAVVNSGQSPAPQVENNDTPLEHEACGLPIRREESP